MAHPNEEILARDMADAGRVEGSEPEPVDMHTSIKMGDASGRMGSEGSLGYAKDSRKVVEERGDLGSEGALGEARSTEDVSKERSVLGGGERERLFLSEAEKKEKETSEQESEKEQRNRDYNKYLAEKANREASRSSTTEGVASVLSEEAEEIIKRVSKIADDKIVETAKTMAINFPDRNETRAISKNMIPLMLQDFGGQFPTGRFGQVLVNGKFGLGPAPETGTEGLDLSKAAFGYKINPDEDNSAEVKIYNGMLLTDSTARTPVEVQHIPFVISGTQTIYVQADVTDVAGTAEMTTTPSESLDYRVFRLYEFTESGGIIDDSLTKIYRPFDIELGFNVDELPDGTEANPHLVWDNDTGEWVIGEIVPDGSESYPHLVWNHETEIWEADKLFTLPDGGDVNKMAAWDAGESDWLAKESSEITVVTDIQYDVSTHQLQKKTQLIRILPLAEESEWTMITGGQAEVCP